MSVTINNLQQFREKGAAWQSQATAVRLLTKLKELLTEEEYTQLEIAHSHYKLGEGRKELDAVVTDLIKKYSNA